MTVYLVYSRTSDLDYQYLDWKHAASQLKHIALRDGLSETELNENWSICSYYNGSIPTQY